MFKQEEGVNIFFHFSSNEKSFFLPKNVNMESEKLIWAPPKLKWQN